MSVEQWFEKANAYFNHIMNEEEIRLFEEETAASEELSNLMQLWKTTDAEAALYEQSKEGAAALIATHQKLKAGFVNEQTTHEFSIAENKTTQRVRKIKIAAWQWITAAAVITGIIFMVTLLIPSTTKTPVVQTTSTPENNITAAPNDSTSISTKEPEKNIIIPPKQNETTALYAQAFVPDKIPEDPNGLLDDAFFYYARAQYKNAIAAIDNVGNKTATRGSDSFTALTAFYALYYKALSMMSLNNTAGAIPLLQNAVKESPAAILTVKAQWYLALAYLKENKISSSVAILQLIKNNPASGLYKSKAEKILTAIPQ